MAWAEGRREPAPGGNPDVSFLPPMQRRRMSRMSRMALNVAIRCTGDEASTVRCVFASRYGEQTTSLRLLREVVTKEPLSPTAFSHSVHNTASGLFAIQTKNRTASTSIAARRDTFGYAWLEAAQNLHQDPTRPVLLVVADEPLPDVYASYADELEASYALALLLRSEETGRCIHTHCNPLEPETTSQYEPPAALSFYRWWLHGAESTLAVKGQRCLWRWNAT